MTRRYYICKIIGHQTVEGNDAAIEISARRPYTLRGALRYLVPHVKRYGVRGEILDESGWKVLEIDPRGNWRAP